MGLKGIKVLEFAGLAPGPFCGMLLQNFGATVYRIDKLNNYTGVDPLANGKKAIALNLKSSDGQQVIRKLCTRADVLIDPFRPGVLEKMNLSPHHLLKSNQRLIVARLTGYGQTGPMSHVAGHDINYLSLTGLLSMFVNSKTNEKPVPPINILADFAGGGLLCAFGICVSLIERQVTGHGKILDASITEGTSYIGSWIHKSRDPSYALQSLVWPNSTQKSSNLLDGGSAFYNCYQTQDDKFMALGAIEPNFFANFKSILKEQFPNAREKCGLDFEIDDLDQFDSNLADQLTILFRMKTREEWSKIFLFQDACCTPVLELDEASDFVHFKERKSFDQYKFPKPFPQYEGQNSKSFCKPNTIDEHTVEVLQDFEFTTEEIQQLMKKKVISGHSKL